MKMVYTGKKVLLGQLLLEKKLITRDQLELALSEQKKTDELLGIILMRLGFIENEATFLPFVAQQYGLDYIRLRHISIPPEAISRVSSKFAVRHEVMPVDYHDGVLTLAVNRPFDVLLKDEMRILTGCEINPVLAGREDILSTIKRLYGIGVDIVEEIMGHADVQLQQKEKKEAKDIDSVNDVNAEGTINGFLNQIFLEAHKNRASDIHIEPFDDKLVIRYRIDGILQEVPVPDNIKHFKESINSRIKIMAQLDIAEKRRPQDGRFRVSVEGVDLDFRVSLVPSAHGEAVVLRILNSARLFSFEELNLDKTERKILVDLIHRPHGIIFMTGPTGSGKTTTLYSCLSTINTADKKIVTLEDPVEYQLPSIIQIQINPAIDLTFAKGLRSLLRHDPNVILVGEVRDVETAEIAIQVALTGHLIFSTLHTNNAASGVTRLLNMGIEPYLIASTVDCFIAQRLVRTICQHCKKPRKLSPKILEKFHVQSKSDVTVYEGKGCEHCNFTGFEGRIGIFEFLVITDEIGEMVLQHASTAEIENKARMLGMKTLRESGWEKIKMGLTTPEEVIRVTQERSTRK